MKISDCRAHWCPMARISVQRHKVGGGGLDIVPSGAFNRSSAAPGDGTGDAIIAQAGCCIGPRCSWWRISPVSFVPAVEPRGYCGQTGSFGAVIQIAGIVLGSAVSFVLARSAVQAVKAVWPEILKFMGA